MPVLSGKKAVVVRDTLFQCCGCRRQVSATAGTIFQDTRKPLVMWFRAMWYVTSQKNGASALGFSGCPAWLVMRPPGLSAPV